MTDSDNEIMDTDASIMVSASVSSSGVTGMEPDSNIEDSVVAPIGIAPSMAPAPSIQNKNSSGRPTKRLRGNSTKSIKNLASIVKLFVKKTIPSMTSPWKMSSESSSSGTGFLLEGNRLLTNAHVVYRAQSILCRPQSGSKKFECQIEAISLPLDLAVLRVTDEGFFDTRPPLKLVDAGFENLPHLDENVTALGFPTGGDQISVTRGVVSRITYRSDSLLSVQIDAAINPGNSGGPVVNEQGLVVGVAHSVMRQLSNVGYIIPALVVHLFFEATNGRCTAAMKSEQNPDGFPGVASLGICKYQTLESPTLRQHLGMKHIDGGIRVVTVDPLGACYDAETKKLLVQPDDVLLSVNGIAVGEDGTVELPGRPEERIYYGVLVSSQLPTLTVEIQIMRNREILSLKLMPKPRRYQCPRIDGYDCSDPPRYFICGGFVFMILTDPWLKKKRYTSLDNYYGSVPLQEEGREIVILSTVLASSINRGYHNLSGMVLRTLNGERIFNLQHLATCIQNCEEPLLEFRLQVHGTFHSNDESKPNEVVAILDRAECIEADPVIRKSRLIASPCSPGIVFKW